MLTPLEMTGTGWSYTLRIPASKFPLREGGRPKAGGWIRLEEAGAAKQLSELKSPVFSNTRKISGLLAAVAIPGYGLTQHAATRGEACHWILSRLRLPVNPVPLPPEGKRVTGFSVAFDSLRIQFPCHRSK